MPKFPSWDDFKEQQDLSYAAPEEDSSNYLYDSYIGSQSGGNEPQTSSEEDEEKNKDTLEQVQEKPDYSVQESAQQANNGQSYLTTAVGNVTGEQPEQPEQKLGLFEKPEIKTTLERDALIEEYNNLGNPNYLHTKAEREAYMQKHDELLGRLRSIDEELGNGAMDYNFRDRSQSVIGGAIKGYGGDVLNSAATTLQGFNELGEKLGGDTGQYAGWATDEVTRAAIPQEDDPNAREQQRQEVANMQAVSDRLAQSSAEDINRAKAGRSKLAQFGTDLATNAIQMGMDSLAGTLTGIGSLGAMFTRSAGGGAREARQEGASTGQQLVYGAVKGGIEAATEKMFDGLAGLYGAGQADEAIEKLIGKLAQSNDAGKSALRFLFSGLGEAGEEFASSVADPFAKMIYQGIDSLPKNFNSDMVSDTLYSMLVGFAMGSGGGAVNLVNGENARLNAELNEQMAQRSEAQEQTGNTLYDTNRAREAEQARTPAAPSNLGATPSAIGSESGTQIPPAKMDYEGGSADDVLNNVAAAIESGSSTDEAISPFLSLIKGMGDSELQKFTTSGFGNYISESFASLEHEGAAKQAEEILRGALSEELSTRASSVFKSGTKHTARDVSNYLKGRISDPAISEMSDKVFSVAEKLGIDLEVTDKWEPGAVYDFRHMSPKTVHLNDTTFTGVSDAGKTQMLLHEYIHGVSTYLMTEVHKYSALFGNNVEDAPSWYRQNITPEMENAVKTIYDVYHQLTEDPSFKRHVSGTFDYDLSKSDGEHFYGAENAMEMVAELSNPNFRQYLEQKSVLQKIIDAIKTFFGISPSNALDSVSSSFDYILTHANEEAFNQYATNPEITQNDLVDAIHSQNYGRENASQNAAQGSAQPQNTGAQPTQESAPTGESQKLNSEPGEGTESQTKSEPETDNTTEESATADEGTTTEETGEGVPPRPPQQPTGESTSQDYSELGEEYGTMEQGEKAERESNTPKRTAPGTKVSQSVRTVQEAKATPESRLPDIQSAVAQGQTSFVPIKNSERATNAETKIKDKGWSSALKDWTAAVRSGQANADLVAEGAVLLNNAGNNPECTGKEYIDLMLDYVRLNRTMGQGLQAARILKTLSPEGKLYAFQKVVSNMNEDAGSKAKKKSDKNKPSTDAVTELSESTGNKYTIPEELIEKYRQQTDDAGRDAVIDEMQKAIAAQIPSTPADIFTAVRYLNMLGNLKTQARNILGNTGMMAVQKIKNIIRSTSETIWQAATNGKYQKQYSAFYPPELLRVGIRDISQNADVRKEGMGDAKYTSAASQYAKGIRDNIDPFKIPENKLTKALGIDGKKGPISAVLTKYNQATKWCMEMGDQLFVTANYADGLAGYLQAHKISAEQWDTLVAEANADASSEAAQTVDAARQFAIKQAQEATFRDTNAFSKFVSEFDKNWQNNGFVGKTAKTLVEGIVPFRKTPANVAVRMEEYSPLGVVNTLVKAIAAKKGIGNVTGADVIDSLSKTLTGTGLALAGFALAQAGKIRTKSDDDKQEAFDRLQGLQDYSINALGHNITIDWATPTSGALFMGAEAYNLWRNGDLNLANLGSILGSISSPMLEMSMLSGLNDALNNISNFNDDTDALPQFVLNSAWSYLTQGFTNTLLGQLEQANEDYRQTYYTDPDNPLVSTSMQKNLAQFFNKTPGKDYQAADYIDAWGRKQANFDNQLFRYAYALGSPAYVSGDKSTAVDDELQRLYDYGKDIDGFPAVLPKQTSRSTTVNGTRLSADEYEKYATTKGQESLKLITNLLDSSLYENLDDEGKAEAISQCYSYAKYIAEEQIAKGRKEEYYNKDYSDLITGKDSSGTQYDKTALKPDNFVAYTTFKISLDNAVESGDYKAIDKIVSDYGKQNGNLKTVLNERNAVLRALSNWKSAGLNSQDYYTIQKELVKSQQKLDKSQKTGSAVELDALANSNLPESKKRQLVNSLPDYTSKTVKGVYNILSDYGFDSKTINNFWNQSQDWVNKNTGEAQSSQKAGTLQPLEAAYAIQQLPGLTPQQMSDIYNKMREVAHNPYKINDWGNYTFSSEQRYLDSGKAYQDFGGKTSGKQQSTTPPSFTKSKYMKGK